jgi:hypothetical protein
MFGFLHDALVSVINAVLAAIGAVLSTVASVMPSMPAVPAPPAYLSYINFFFPVAAVVGIFSGMLTAYIAFLAIRTMLRWVKAL